MSRSLLAAQDFDADLRHLLDLARVWPAASGAVAQRDRHDAKAV
ncbi:hypothetical protein [Nocardia sp. Marseille-Q1738]